MSRICRCSKKCRHLVYGTINPLLLPEELDALALVKAGETAYMDEEGSVR